MFAVFDYTHFPIKNILVFFKFMQDLLILLLMELKPMEGMLLNVLTNLSFIVMKSNSRCC